MFLSASAGCQKGMPTRKAGAKLLHFPDIRKKKRNYFQTVSNLRGLMPTSHRHVISAVFPALIYGFVAPYPPFHHPQIWFPHFSVALRNVFPYRCGKSFRTVAESFSARDGKSLSICCCPYRAHLHTHKKPRAMPWAISSCPFGAYFRNMEVLIYDFLVIIVIQCEELDKVACDDAK